MLYPAVDLPPRLRNLQPTPKPNFVRLSCLLTAPQPTRRTVCCKRVRNCVQTTIYCKYLSGRPGRVPLINGGGKSQVNSNSDGVPNVPKRTYSIQGVTNWIGERDNPRTTVQCSSPSRNPNQHVHAPRSTPFQSLYSQTKYLAQRSSPKGSLVHVHRLQSL